MFLAFSFFKSLQLYFLSMLILKTHSTENCMKKKNNKNAAILIKLISNNVKINLFSWCWYSNYVYLILLPVLGIDLKSRICFQNQKFQVLNISLDFSQLPPSSWLIVCLLECDVDYDLVCCALEFVVHRPRTVKV